MITNTAMTVYNKYVDPSSRSEKFLRCVISAVLWESAQAVAAARHGTISSDKATIAIPFVNSTNYLAPKAWLALSVVGRAGKWTLQEGDVVVRGTITDEIAGAFTMTSLRETYDDVLQITSVGRMDQGSPNTHHYLVGAK